MGRRLEVVDDAVEAEDALLKLSRRNTIGLGSDGCHADCHWLVVAELG